MSLKPSRCPYLEGDGKQKYEGVVFPSRTKHLFEHRCPIGGHIMFNAWGEHAASRGCLNGEYTSCQNYSQQTLELSIAIPLTCPVAKEETTDEGRWQDTKCAVTGESCEIYYELEGVHGEYGYRSCPTFSQWFWGKAAKEVEL